MKIKCIYLNQIENSCSFKKNRYGTNLKITNIISRNDFFLKSLKYIKEYPRPLIEITNLITKP